MSTGEKIPEYVTKEANLGEITGLYPISADVLLEYGLHCVGCIAAGYDTVELGAKMHGMSDEDIEEMIGRVNEAIFHGEVKPITV